MAVWIVNDMLRGRGVSPSPSNSAPRHRGEKPKKKRSKARHKSQRKDFGQFSLTSILRSPEVIKNQIQRKFHIFPEMRHYLKKYFH